MVTLSSSMRTCFENRPSCISVHKLSDSTNQTKIPPLGGGIARILVLTTTHGSENRAVDALSQWSLVIIQCEVAEFHHLCASYSHDHAFFKVWEAVLSGSIEYLDFSIEDELLFRHGNRLCVPEGSL